MNRCLMTFAAVAALAGFACQQFPTRYERIDPDALRSTGFTYSPYAEGAPGDTIRVRGYFAGQGVVSVAWKMSYNHVFDIYGRSDTVLDLFDLPAAGSVSYLPDSADISFAVPDSVYYLTKGISRQVLDTLRAMLPQSMHQMTQQDFASLLQDMAGIDFNDPLSAGPFLQKWGTVMGGTAGDPSELQVIAPAAALVLKALTIPAVIIADVMTDGGVRLRIRGDFTIRYNRRYQNTPFASFVPVNNNPTLRWIGMYAVKGKNIMNFSPADPAFAGKFTLTYFHNEFFPDSVHDTVLIDTGYTYFVAADSGIVAYHPRAVDSVKGADSSWRLIPSDSVVLDTTLDKIHFLRNGRDTFELESVQYDWQYQNIALDSVTKPVDSLFFIPGVGEGGWQPPIMQVLPPVDTKMTHARLWVTVYDWALGEENRPVGFAIKNVDIYFTYSAAYAQKHR
jgi:hypothetical protein